MAMAGAASSSSSFSSSQTPNNNTERPDASDAPDAHASPPKKRRTGATTTNTTTTTTSSRGVANLTPEQLARKRANDREAQRAIRERTKNQIDRLNQRIRELENQQPYHDLQLVLREKAAVQAENAGIRQRLESVVALIQPVLRASGGLNELAAAAERSPLPVPPPPPPRDPPTSQPSQPSHHDGRHYNATLYDMAAASASPPNATPSPAATEGGRAWLFPGDAPTSHLRRWSNGSPHPLEHQRQPHLPPDMAFDERMGVDFLLSDSGQRRPIDPNLPPPPQQLGDAPANNSANGLGQHAPLMVPYLTLPRNVPPTCPLDVILLDFLAERQARAADGVPMKTLVGPTYPNFTALVYPERNTEAHPLSKLFTDILRTFPDVAGLPEQVAIVFIMFLIMRWQIEPTQENYDRLPEWMAPRASQLFVPHPCWFDHIPWPRLRDHLISSHNNFSIFDSFFIPFTTTISLNWPYSPKDCLVPTSRINPATASLSATSSIPASSPHSVAVHPGSPHGPPTPQTAAGNTPGPSGLAGQLSKDNEQWLINPAFESHLRDLSNWTLGPSFRSGFPTFGDLVKIKETR